MIRFIVGVILGHILCYFLIFYVSGLISDSMIMFEILNVGFGLTINIGYLLYVCKQKQMPIKWITINKWVAPIFITIGVLQWFSLFLLFSELIFIDGLMLLFYYCYIFRISLLFELPIIGYLYYKVYEHLSSFSSEE